MIGGNKLEFLQTEYRPCAWAALPENSPIVLFKGVAEFAVTRPDGDFIFESDGKTRKTEKWPFFEIYASDNTPNRIEEDAITGELMSTALASESHESGYEPAVIRIVDSEDETLSSLGDWLLAVNHIKKHGGSNAPRFRVSEGPNGTLAFTPVN